MKITELIFNDLVSVIPSGLQIRIAAIHDKKIAYYAKGGLNWVKLSLIRPIPITPELLTRIGFQGVGYLFLDLDESSYLEYYLFEGRLRKISVAVDEWNNHSVTKEITFQCQCKYINELQHAFRMCGLDVLANDFKFYLLGT